MKNSALFAPSTVKMVAGFLFPLLLGMHLNANAVDEKNQQAPSTNVTVVKPEPAGEKKSVTLPIPFSCIDVRDLPFSGDLPPGLTKLKVDLTYMGTVSKIEITQSSGNAQYDELARSAYSKCNYAYSDKGNPYVVEHNWLGSFVLAGSEKLRCISSRVLKINDAVLERELPAVESRGTDFIVHGIVWDDGSIYKIKPGFVEDDVALEKALTKYVQTCKLLPTNSDKKQKISLHIEASAPLTRHFSLDSAEYKKYSEWKSKTWTGGNEYRTFHILFDNEASANETLSKIQNGESFEDLAKVLSKDPGSARNGGDLSWSVPRVFVPTFRDALFSMKAPGLYPTVVKTAFGWHIIRVDGIRPEPFPSREEVNSDLRKRFKQVRELLLKGEAE